ncbi:ankyrin repeat-containing domain protein [Lactarius psammicola]|nr:ankyrin repeat-containing domain protein [Lactarius psammicola]
MKARRFWRKFVELNGDASLENKTGETSVHQVSGSQCGSQEHDAGDSGVIVAQLLLERGADVNALDGDNKTPLHLASYFGKVEMVLVLLNAGANANAKNAQGQTPLHLVSQFPLSKKEKSAREFSQTQFRSRRVVKSTEVKTSQNTGDPSHPKSFGDSSVHNLDI